MEIKTLPVNASTNNLACPLCQSIMDFMFQESFDEGLKFKCNKCDKKIIITNNKL